MDKSFEDALETASRIVETWPKWKQDSLVVSSMATSPVPREPIEPASDAEIADAQIAKVRPSFEAFLVETWGERCPDYCEDCVLCAKWKALDDILENPFR